MEFNNRTMLSLEGVPGRKLDVQRPDDVCTKVVPHAKEACYFWLPTWWMQVIHGTMVDKFSGSAELCQQVPANMQMMCFHGLSNEIGSFTTDVEEIKHLCHEGDSENPLFIMQCLSSAASALRFSGKTPQESKLLCSELIDEQYDYCYNLATVNYENRPRPFTPPS